MHTRPLRRLLLLAALLLPACAEGTAVGDRVAGGIGPASPEPTADVATDTPPAQPAVPPVSPSPGSGVDPDTPVSSDASTGICAPGVTDCVDTAVGSEVPCPPEGCSGDPADVPHQDTAVVATRGTPRAVPFDDAEVGPDGRTVTVRWWSGVAPCHALAAVDVVETPDAVTITVQEASVHPDDEEVACIEVAQAKQHTVTLTEPVGDREVVDGAV